MRPSLMAIGQKPPEADARVWDTMYLQAPSASGERQLAWYGPMAVDGTSPLRGSSASGTIWGQHGVQDDMYSVISGSR